MSQKVFIPITDEILYEYPELITSPLRPYQLQHPCFHWMATIDSGQTGQPTKLTQKIYERALAVLNKDDQTGSRLA